MNKRCMNCTGINEENANFCMYCRGTAFTFVDFNEGLRKNKKIGVIGLLFAVIGLIFSVFFAHISFIYIVESFVDRVWFFLAFHIGLAYLFIRCMFKQSEKIVHWIDDRKCKRK